jgi:hypothetical protein
MSTPVDGQFGGSGKLCSTYTVPVEPAPTCTVGQQYLLTGPPNLPGPQFEGEGHFHAAGNRFGPYSLVFFPVSGTFYAVADPSVSGTINTPIVQPVNALVTFTPRLPIGFQAFMDHYLVSAAFNAEQTISMIGNPTQGTWTIQSPLNAADITPSMPFNITPAALQTELAALPSIGAGNVLVVQGVNPQSYQVEFTGALGATTVPPLVLQWIDLIDANGYDCTITVATSATGSPQVVAPTSISIPPRQARIMAGVLSTIDYVDTPGVQLVCDDELLGIPADFEPLIYDVAFTAVSFNDASQVLGNFAFQAPTDGTAVCISDPKLVKLPYQKPITHVWSPDAATGFETGSVGSVASMSGWRARVAREQKIRIGA